MINNQLRDEIGALNASKGWHDKPRYIAEHCILLHSEVSEIVEDYRNNHPVDQVWYEYNEGEDINDDRYIRIYEDDYILGKPCGIPSELADVVIRALDMAYEYGCDVDLTQDDLKELDDIEDLNAKGFEFLLATLHKIISDFITEEEDVDYLIKALIVVCFYIANRYNINLEQQIRDKIEYNKTRPHKHGGKRL